MWRGAWGAWGADGILGLEQDANWPLGCSQPFPRHAGERQPRSAAPAASDLGGGRGKGAKTDLRG